jgi:hypothetical protein
VLDSPYTVVTLSNFDFPSEPYIGVPTVALVTERAKRDAAQKP